MELKQKRYAGLRALLAKYGFSQKNLAEMLGITDASVSAKINGTTEWSLVELTKMADFFLVSVDFLLDRE